MILFLTGVFIGAAIGIIVMSLLAVNRDSDKHSDDLGGSLNEKTGKQL